MVDRVITSGKHMLLNTFRKSGLPVSTPVWTVPVSDGRVGMWTAAGTGKYQRLRNNPHVTIQACTARGNTKPGTRILQGTAEIVQNGALFDEVQTKIHAKYGRMIPIVKRVSRLQGRFKADQTFGDTVVLITVASDQSVRDLAQRWADTWSRAWPARDALAITDLQAADGRHFSSPFTRPIGAGTG